MTETNGDTARAALLDAIGLFDSAELREVAELARARLSDARIIAGPCVLCGNPNPDRLYYASADNGEGVVGTPRRLCFTGAKDDCASRYGRGERAEIVLFKMNDDRWCKAKVPAWLLKINDAEPETKLPIEVIPDGRLAIGRAEAAEPEPASEPPLRVVGE